jgi:leucyl aminopeptidase
MPATIALHKGSPLSHAADVLLVPVVQEKSSGKAVAQVLEDLDGAFEGQLSLQLKRVRFNGEKGTTAIVPTLGRLECEQIVFVGVGPLESLRPAGLAESIAVGVRAALALRPKQMALAASDAAHWQGSGDAAFGLSALGLIALGARLGFYQFDKYFGEKQRGAVTLERLHLLGAKGTAAELEKAIHIADGVCLARDLVNEPPNELYPETFARRAQAVAKAEGLHCTVWDEKQILAHGMNLHHAVGKGSVHQPRFVHLTYKPPGAKGRVAFVGKGLTFDSGGLCIKPMQGMADMKSDMAGGAAVLGLMAALPALGVNVEVHGIIGMAENMPDANAYRPADVIRSLSGKGVEIINTDAEGRLVLADALTYASRLNPDFIVDAATLTGATLVSLGSPYSAFFTGNDALAQGMNEAAQAAGESFWRMPLIEELAQELKSDITDLQHTGQRFGGAISAALFLREFVDGKPWIHTDIPGATFRDRASGLHPKGGTGHAVLTFLELVYRHSKSPLVPHAAAPARAKSAPPKAAAKKAKTAKRSAR